MAGAVGEDGEATPRRHISTAYVVMLAVGMVVGAGIFRSPAQVAEAAGSEGWLYAFWILGGVLSLAGALCYSELSSAFAHPGGDYHFLRLAYGEGTAFLFAWSRLAVINSGSIAFLGFVIGDYLNATPLFHAGPHGPALYALVSVVLFMALNLRDTYQGRRGDYAATGLEVAGLVVIAAAAAVLIMRQEAPAAPGPAGFGAGVPTGAGLAMVFVLLAFGGWSEIATLSAEIKDKRRGMARAHLFSILAITTLYLLVNWAMVRGLGLHGLAQSDAPAADLARLAFGPVSGLMVALAVSLAAMTSINATVIVGARTTYAAAQDFPALHALARWDSARGIPARATLAQGAVSIALVGLGALTRDGFSTLVDYTAPAFWIFMTLSGFAVIVLRRKFPDAERPYRTPLYPFTPLLFCAANIFMLWSSISYVISLPSPRIGMAIGVAVLASGLGLWFVLRPKAQRAI